MTKHSGANEEIRASAERAAGTVNVREAVHDLTVKALSLERIDAARIKEVVTAVVDGVMQGAAHSGVDMRATLGAAWQGLDDALGKSAEAVKLTLEEAGDQLGQFADTDLQKAIDELRALEGLFVETVEKAATGADKTARAVMQDLAAHARRSGTDVGRRAQDAASALQGALDTAARGGVKGAVGAGGSAVRQIAQVASGVLAGLAEKLDSVSRAAPSGGGKKK